MPTLDRRRKDDGPSALTVKGVGGTERVMFEKRPLTPPTIVPKHELIQVDVKLWVTDPMVGTDQPKSRGPQVALRRSVRRG